MGKNTIKFWNEYSGYYRHTEDTGAAAERDPALKRLKESVKDSMRILDIGCGDGSKLIDIGRKVDIKGYGIDASSIAINIARKKSRKYSFICSSSKRLPFRDNFFDIAYSTYVFEHLTNPSAMLKEMKRVVKKGGKVVIICPNFGSPLYPSPVTKKIPHLLRCIIRDIKYLFISPKTLEWQKETPILDKENFKPDYDTTVLPYVYSLKKANKGCVFASSTWRNFPAGNTLFLRMLRSPFKLMGILGIYPFKWWGPICICIIKKSQ